VVRAGLLASRAGQVPRLAFSWSCPTMPPAFPEYPVTGSDVLAYSCAAARDLHPLPIFVCVRQRHANPDVYKERNNEEQTIIGREEEVNRSVSAACLGPQSCTNLAPRAWRRMSGSARTGQCRTRRITPLSMHSSDIYVTRKMRIIAIQSKVFFKQDRVTAMQPV
jgi:hypothetical protein